MASSAPELSRAGGGGRCSSYLHFIWIAQLTLLAALFRLGAASGSTSFAVDNGGTIPGRVDGIRAALIHRDKFFGESSSNDGRNAGGSQGLSSSSLPAVGSSHDDAARRSVRRVQALERQSRSRRQPRYLAADEDEDAEATATSSRRSRLQATSPSTSPAAAAPDGDWESPLSDASTSEYIMEITLGSPGQTYHAVADTGSDLTWLQCAPCEAANCFKQEDPLYDPTKSSTYKAVSCASDACNFLSDNANCVYDSSAADGTECDYNYKYGDESSTTGTLAQDTISLEAFVGESVQKFANFTFGCSHNASTSSDLFEVTDGLVGLGRGAISFPQQLGEYFGNKFSYCLVNRLNNEVEESPLVFGDAALSDGATLQYTPLSDNPVSGTTTFYYVELDNITVNGVAAPLPDQVFGYGDDGSGGIIFDSGTTFTSLVGDALEPLLRTVSAAVTGYELFDSSGTIWDLCYKSSWDSWSDDFGKGVPKVSFNFLNASSFDLGVEASWAEVRTGVICAAFLRSDSNSIIGAHQQIDKLILYDLNNSVIGFVPRKCEGSDSSLRQPNSADKFGASFDRTISFLFPAFILLLHVSFTMIMNRW